MKNSKNRTSHKFDPSNKRKLDNPERRKSMPPEMLLSIIGLKEGDRFLDIGAGTGYFSIEASKMVGKEGNVIAIDISDEMLDELKTSAEKRGILNIELMRSEEYNFPVDGNSMDSAIASMIIHEVEDTELFINEINRVLKNNAKLLIVEWIKVKMDKGPPVHERISPEDLHELLAKNGFTILKVENIDSAHYLLLAEKHGI